MRIINENTFNINKFKESKLGVNCKTKEDAEMFLEMLNNDYDINWDTNRTTSYKNKDGKYDTYWDKASEKTFYRWHECQVLVHDNIQYFPIGRIEIVEFQSLNNKKYNNSEVENMLNAKIHWKDFVNEEFVIHCKSESEINELLQWIYKNAEDEIKNSPLVTLSEGWLKWQTNVCYYIDCGYISYCDKSNCDDIVLEWSGKNLYEINGTIETDMDIDELNDKFIEFIESINGEFAGGIK